MSDESKFKKPEHIKNSVWEMHLTWMDVLGKQAEENLKKRREARKVC